MKAVILDVSGVLRDNRQAIWDSCRRALSAKGIAVTASADHAYRLRGLTEYNLVENAIEAICALQDENVDVQDAIENPEKIADAVKKHPLPDKHGIAQDAKADFRRTDADHLASIHPLPKSRQALENFTKKYKVGAFSNGGTAFNRAWLSFHGLDGFFGAILAEQDVPRKKPHPDGIWACAKQLDVNPTDAYYVGDAQSDMIAAQNAQAVPIGVLSGAATKKQLERAGAFHVYADACEASEAL
ncbi:HAD family hydrolase [Candidatus Micrarchaeota archaeon]|nr:HAD family hydrolase [Candidatus Micrarchaeota archaeon]